MTATQSYGAPSLLPPYARILVVDDSATTRKLVRHMLSQLGRSNIDEATDGGDALGKIAKFRYGLVISDWVMEPMGALELLEAMRRSQETARLPFIMMTGQNQRRFAEVSRDAGFLQFLAKPFDIATLAARISAIGGRGEAS